MRNLIITAVFILGSSPLWAENISGEDELLCSSSRALLCVEDGDCFDVPPSDLDMPRFVIIDTDKETISTTRASGQNRTTRVSGIERADGLIVLQGIDNGRAFSFVIEEDSGVLTAAVAHHGLSVSVFGVCTSADVK